MVVASLSTSSRPFVVALCDGGRPEPRLNLLSLKAVQSGLLGAVGSNSRSRVQCIARFPNFVWDNQTGNKKRMYTVPPMSNLWQQACFIWLVRPVDFLSTAAKLLTSAPAHVWNCNGEQLNLLMI